MLIFKLLLILIAIFTSGKVKEALLANLHGTDTATVGDKYQLAEKISMQKHFL